eukprot:4044765-Amphidinium_carterae.1
MDDEANYEHVMWRCPHYAPTRGDACSATFTMAAATGMPHEPLGIEMQPDAVKRYQTHTVKLWQTHIEQWTQGVWHERVVAPRQEAMSEEGTSQPNDPQPPPQGAVNGHQLRTIGEGSGGNHINRLLSLLRTSAANGVFSKVLDDTHPFFGLELYWLPPGTSLQQAQDWTHDTPHLGLVEKGIQTLLAVRFRDATTAALFAKERALPDTTSLQSGKSQPCHRTWGCVGSP